MGYLPILQVAFDGPRSESKRSTRTPVQRVESVVSDDVELTVAERLDSIAAVRGFGEFLALPHRTREAEGKSLV